MLALLGLSVWAAGKHFVSPSSTPTFDHSSFREKGVIGQRSFLGMAAERERVRGVPLQRREQPPELRKVLINPEYKETAANIKARQDRLYEAMSDGPFGFVRGKVDRDRDLIANRLPYMHKGLTRIGGWEHQHNVQGDPVVR